MELNGTHSAQRLPQPCHPRPTLNMSVVRFKPCSVIQLICLIGSIGLSFATACEQTTYSFATSVKSLARSVCLDFSESNLRTAQYSTSSCTRAACRLSSCCFRECCVCNFVHLTWLNADWPSFVPACSVFRMFGLSAASLFSLRTGC